MKNRLIPFVLFSLALYSCGKTPEPTPTPEPDPAPKTITLSQTAISVGAEGGSYEITVKSPFVPQVEKPSWVTVTAASQSVDKDYNVKMSVTVAKNDTYEVRETTLTFKATGATSATLKVSQAAGEKPVPPTPGGNDGLASFFGLGWNLGNHFDAYYNWKYVDEKGFDWLNYPCETLWDNSVVSQATFDGVKKAGFTSVRIPVTWLKMIGDAPDYKINEEWINRVYEVVQFAHNAGLKVIINTHHDENHNPSFSDVKDAALRQELISRSKVDLWLDILGASNDSALNESIKAKIKGVWTNIANKFKDCGDDWLMMESFNELNDGGWGWSEDFKKNPQKQCNILNEWNQVFVDAVRATGGYNSTRWLGVPSYCANPEFTKYMTIPNDPAKKVAVSVHCYDPSDFALGKTNDEGKRYFPYSDWGHTGDPSKKVSGSDEDYIKNKFATLYADYVAKGVPVYIGEFGCCLRTDTRSKAFIKYYFEYVVKCAKTYSLPCFLWDNGVQGGEGENHGYINHSNGNYIGGSKEFVDVITRAWNTESSGYTLDYVYTTAPKF